MERFITVLFDFPGQDDFIPDSHVYIIGNPAIKGSFYD